jgi:large repetitive protein
MRNLLLLIAATVLCFELSGEALWWSRPDGAAERNRLAHFLLQKIGHGRTETQPATIAGQDWSSKAAAPTEPSPATQMANSRLSGLSDQASEPREIDSTSPAPSMIIKRDPLTAAADAHATPGSQTPYDAPRVLTVSSRTASQATPASSLSAQEAISIGQVTREIGGTAANTIEVSGTALPGSRVGVAIDQSPFGMTTANAKGIWHLSNIRELSPGRHVAVAGIIQASDGRAMTLHYAFLVPKDAGSSGGNLVQQLKPDDTPESAATAMNPAEFDLSKPSYLSSAGMPGNLTLSDSGTTGGAVAIAIDGTSKGSVPVTDGHWTAVEADMLALGRHTIVAEERDEIGRPIARESIELDVSASTQPSAVATTNGGSSQTSTNSGGAISEAPGDLLSIVRVTWDIRGGGKGDVIISGEAPVSSKVLIAVDGVPAGRISTDAAGQWNFDTGKPLRPGRHVATAALATTGGKATASKHYAFIVPASIQGKDGNLVAQLAPDDTAPDESGATPVRAADFALAKTTFTSNANYSGDLIVTGVGSQGGTVNMTLDGTAVGNAPIGKDGHWSFAESGKLLPGRHTLVAEERSLAGRPVARESSTFDVAATPGMSASISGSAGSGQKSSQVQSRSAAGASTDVAQGQPAAPSASGAKEAVRPPTKSHGPVAVWVNVLRGTAWSRVRVPESRN